MILFQNGKRYIESKYSIESEFEQEIVNSHKLFFGNDVIYIDAKKKIGSVSLGESIPDGFLFDMSDPENREFYLVEVELASHHFYDHIFPQITKFFAFFKNISKQKELIEKIFAIINASDLLKQQFREYLGSREIYKFLIDVVDASQNILIVIDGDKAELPEIIDTYSDTWGRMVKVITARKFVCDNEVIYAVSPEFDAIEYSYQTPPTNQTSGQELAVSEEFHLEGVSDIVKKTYKVLKEKFESQVPVARLNIAKNYISIRDTKNVAFLLFRKKKIVFVMMMPEEQMKKMLPSFNIKTLSESAQSYYNGPCAEIQLTGTEHLDEVVKAVGSLLPE